MSKDQVRFIDNRPLLYEGSQKILFDGSQYNTSFLHFKDSIRGPSKNTCEIKDKGIINNALSAYIFEKLNIYGFQTHYILKQNSREQLVQSLEIIPACIHVFNIAPDHIVKAMGLSNGVFLPTPVVEYYSKPNASTGAHSISPDHLEALGLVSSEEIKEIKKLALDVNNFLIGFFSALGLQLNDVKLEFGRRYNEIVDDTEIVLADEISLDTCHLVDMVDESTLGYKSINDCADNNELVYQKFVKRCPFSLLESVKAPPAGSGHVVSINKKNLNLFHGHCSRPAPFFTQRDISKRTNYVNGSCRRWGPLPG